MAPQSSLRPSLLAGFAILAASTQAYVMPDGHTGKLPTLGWNSWNAYHCDITEEKFLSAAEALVQTGLRDAGYKYVNIDDCWSLKDGRVNGHIAPNTTRFPDGIDGLAKKIHNMDLKFAAGTETCAGYPASLGYEDVDAEDFSNWGVDYLKYDNCNVPQEWQDQYVACHEDQVKSKSAERFARMRDALAKQKREILYSMCIWGVADIFSWGNSTGVNWRMSGDISPNWESVLHIVNINSFKLNYVDFWGHNDADMLEVGNGLSPEETRTHFALWAAMKSPLLIGTDLKQLSQDSINVLKNKHLLAFNQDDVYGRPATPYKWGVNPNWTYNSTNPAEFWAGPSKNGHLILMLNTLNQKVNKVAKWSEVPGLSGTKYHVKDVWTGKDLGCLDSYSVDVAAHDTAAVLVGRECKKYSA
ncbi:putative alpha-galactosidase B [Cladobotryum mycophilum]|uniref:Alpha-galactosidase n=1 Tax=Cladobotryum mycophilum TaxID=491253 RepID=A0ABR0S6Q4_9HYPO